MNGLSDLSMFFAKLGKLDGDTIQLSKNEFKILMSIAEDGMLIHRRSMKKIFDRLFGHDEINVLDNEDKCVFIKLVTEAMISLSDMVNATTIRLNMEEDLKKSSDRISKFPVHV